MLTELLADLDRDDSPFDDEVPRVDAQGTHWVEPVLVVDVDSHATAKNQRLRQPSYRGVRSDLTPGGPVMTPKKTEAPPRSTSTSRAARSS